MAAPGSALQAKFESLGLEASPEEFIDSLKPPVKRRVQALQELQEKHEELEAQFRKERAALEAKYEQLYAPLYSERQDIVTGSKAVPPKEGEEAGGEDNGIPEFWLTVLMKCDITADLIKEKDVEVLTHLTNITCESLLTEEGASKGFKLKFAFKENPYFTNQVLEKTYELSPEDEGVLEKAVGTTIDWKAGKDVTVKIMKKKNKKGKADAKPQIKTEKVESFFNFFSPPDLPGEDDEIEEEQMEELQMQVEQDYEVGAMLREKLIPHAVRWFTGEAAEEDGLEFGDYEGEDDEDEEGEEGEDDDEDEDDDSPPPKAKAKKGGRGAAAGAVGAAGGAANPECQQQ